MVQIKVFSWNGVEANSYWYDSIWPPAVWGRVIILLGCQNVVLLLSDFQEKQAAIIDKE
jgi:hypothetical protein